MFLLKALETAPLFQVNEGNYGNYGVLEAPAGEEPSRRQPSFMRVPKDLLGNLVKVEDLFVRNDQRLSNMVCSAVVKSAAQEQPKPAKQAHPDASSDSIYGEGEIGAHLFFSYQKATCEDRHFGHYDLTVPGLGRVWFAHPEAQ